MVNIHFLPCAWCAFIFFLCFYSSWPPQGCSWHLCLPSLSPSVFKRSGHFLPLQTKSSPSSSVHYFVIQSLSSSLGLCVLSVPAYFLTSLLPILPLPTPLSPSQTHFFISTPTLSTHWCNGADSEEIKRSGKKKKRKMSACTCTVSLCHSTRLHFVTPSSSVFQLYFREHKFSATGYKFPLQHATGCHFVLICCWSLAKIIPLTHAHTNSLLPPHHHSLTRPRSQERPGSG